MQSAAPLALAALGVVSLALSAAASTRPKIGGTLRVEIAGRLEIPDPRQSPEDGNAATTAQRVESLVFDRLVRLDEHGTPQPALAVSWQHDAEAKRWEFRLRPGVKFSDGAPLTSPIAAMALQQLLGITYDVSAASDSVIVQSDRPLPGLASELASGRYFIFRVAEDNSIVGTGPFRIAEWPVAYGAGKAILIANESCWAGRPFVDKIDLAMAVSPQQQANALSFGEADVVELPASDVRRAAQRSARAVSSDPVELFALVVESSRPSLQDARLRQAVSLAIDRASIADVILQKGGQAAGGLLPNWISGYAHLLPPAFDLARAKDLLAAIGREHSRPAPLAMVYDSSDAEARAIAERVAVNLREGGIPVQATGQASDKRMKSPAADLRVVRRRVFTPDPAAALGELLRGLGEPAPPMDSLQDVYNAERVPLESFRVIPLVHVPESYALGPNVRDWMAPRWGGWDLADVWLGPPAAAGSGAGGSAP